MAPCIVTVYDSRNKMQHEFEQSPPAPVRLRRREAGVYETEGGAYGIVKVDSIGEWDVPTTCEWAIIDGNPYDGLELTPTYRTKREAAAALALMISMSEQPEPS